MTINEIITYYGSELQAAATIEISISTIRRWIKDDVIPYHMQLAIQTLTKNKLRAKK